MKRLFKLDILLPWAALAVMAGCAHRVPAVAVEAAPVAHIVPLPRSLETRPGTLRIAAAVAVEDAGAAPWPGVRWTNCWRRWTSPTRTRARRCACNGSTTPRSERRATDWWWTMRST
ncbi:hypothetical protein [Stenotrophomonas acidaminiphila]|uniref:hypothetical protein n=1 Tax=Stenotrophomonas acidaminiphila TaxID=128780 RepID=UPI0028AB03BF|nr:hypothetical protein [Stenotrophomonas acidaminiphila]